METPGYASKLSEPIRRAMSIWLYYALAVHKIITYADLINRFGIKKVITSLSPEVRGAVFCACNGGGDAVRASKVDAESIALMITTMQKQELVNEELICKEIPLDHIVEVLPNKELYDLLFGEDERRPWWHLSKDFMAAVHAVIHEEELLEPDEYVELLETKLVHERTPPKLLVKAVAKANELHRDAMTFTGEDFVKIYSPEEIVGYVDLPDLFPAIEAVAKRQGWVKLEEPNPSMDSLVRSYPSSPLVSEGEVGGLPREALDSDPPGASEATSEGEDKDPEVIVTPAGSVPPEAGLEDVSDGEFEELEALDEDGENTDVRDAASPPPLGGKKKNRRKDAAAS